MRRQDLPELGVLSSLAQHTHTLWIDKAAATTDLTEKTPHFPRHGALSEGKGGCASSIATTGQLGPGALSRPTSLSTAQLSLLLCSTLLFDTPALGTKNGFRCSTRRNIPRYSSLPFPSFRGFETQAVGKVSRRGALDGQVHDSFNSGDIKQPIQDRAGPTLPTRLRKQPKPRRTEHVRRLLESVTSRRTAIHLTQTTPQSLTNPRQHVRQLGKPPRRLPLVLRHS